MDKQLSLESAVFILAFGSSQRKTIGGDFRVCNNKSCGKYVCFSFVDVFLFIIVFFPVSHSTSPIYWSLEVTILLLKWIESL